MQQTFTVIKIDNDILWTDYDIYYLTDLIDKADKNKLFKLKAHEVRGKNVYSKEYYTFINLNRIAVITTVDYIGEAEQ